MKVDYANNRCLGGTMVWAVSTDDAQGSAAAALANLSGRSIIAMSSHSGTDDQVQSCRLGECGESCSDGLSPAQRSDGNDKGNTGTNTGCKGDESRLYCCPPDNMPTCRWRGTAPFCDGKCHDGEVEVSSSLSGTGHDCWTGHKVLCCTQNAATEAVSHCRWTGSAPFCAAPLSKADCPDGRERLTYSNYGAGGEQPCITGYKVGCLSEKARQTILNLEMLTMVASSPFAATNLHRTRDVIGIITVTGYYSKYHSNVPAIVLRGRPQLQRILQDASQVCSKSTHCNEVSVDQVLQVMGLSVATRPLRP